MKLLNYKNTHFDLIVEKGHPLLGQGQGDKQEGEDSKGAGEVQEKEVYENIEAGKVQEKECGEKVFPCAYCGEKKDDNNELLTHIKLDHKDDFILSLEKKLKEASDENIKSENKIHKLVKDLEQVKIENNELKTLTKFQRTELQKTPGDDTYDNEDEAEFDSKKEILQAKDRGFRRSGPQAKPIEVFSVSTV